jgi:hypothetical protein
MSSRRPSRRLFVRRSPSPFTTPKQDGGVMRLIGRIIIAVIVVTAVYLIVDFSGRIWAEAYVAGEIEHTLGLSGKPDVTFGGPLFLPQLLQGKLSSATAQSENFTAGGVAFTAADLHLNDIEFSPGKLLFHQDSTIVADSGHGSVTMTASQLSDAFHNQGIPVNVRFDPSDGSVRVSASQFPASAKVDATIEDGRLVLRPTKVPFNRFSFPLTLPEFVPGMTYTDIAFDGTLATLSFRLKNSTFSVPGS